MNSTCLPRVEAAPRTQLWESKVLLRSSGWFMWLNLVKTSTETWWFWWAGIEIYSFCGCPRQVVCKFPCLLKLPATSLEPSASSGVSPCPPCPRSSFRFHLGKLSRWKPHKHILCKGFSVVCLPVIITLSPFLSSLPHPNRVCVCVCVCMLCVAC